MQIPAEVPKGRGAGTLLKAGAVKWNFKDRHHKIQKIRNSKKIWNLWNYKYVVYKKESPGGRLYSYVLAQKVIMDETNSNNYVVVTHVNLNKQGLANSDLALYIQYLSKGFYLDQNDVIRGMDAFRFRVQVWTE